MDFEEDTRKRGEIILYVCALVAYGFLSYFCWSYFSQNGLPPPNEYPNIFLLVRNLSTAFVLPIFIALISACFTGYKRAPLPLKFCRIVAVIVCTPICLVIALNFLLIIVSLALTLIVFSVALGAWLAEPPIAATAEFAKDLLGGPILIIKGWL